MSHAAEAPEAKVPWSAWEALGVILLTWVGLPLVVGVELHLLAPAVTQAGTFLNALRNGNVTASFLLNLFDAVVGLGLVALILRKYHAGWDALGLRRFKILRSILLLAAILVAFFALVWLALTVIKVLIPSFNVNQPQTNDFTQATTPHARSIAFWALVIVPPIIEETLFRGFLFPAFSKRVGVVMGALLSSALFGLAHLQANVGVYTIILGLLLCFMYRKTGSIIPGMALHMLNNYLAFAVLMSK